MSEEVAGRAGPWPVLSVNQRRVLGVLVEKAKTTPDAYPLSLNALVTGCNQKSNRDPILELDEDDVADTLNELKQMGLVSKIVGGRVERWRHLLYEGWHVDKVELAILGELLLRGAQTEGELRIRASRMEPIDDLETLRSRLKPLVERHLVVYLTPEERRGAMLTHGFHAKHELDRLLSHAASVPAPATATPASSHAPMRHEERSSAESAGLCQELAALRQELAAAQSRIASLEQQTVNLREELQQVRQDFLALKQALGG